MANLPNQAPVNYQHNQFNNQDYRDVRVSDTNMKNTESSNEHLAYHHFSFSAAPMDFDSIDVLWEGGGFMNWPQGGQGRYGMNIYLYNDQNSAWDHLDGFSGGGFVGIEELGGTIFQNVGDYFDVNETMHLMATVPNAMNESTTQIFTDFVRIGFRGNISSNPENPSLNVEGQGDNEWEYAGEFIDMVTINDDHNFKLRLQGFVDAATTGSDVTIALHLSSDAPGILRVRDLMVQYDIILPNEAPEFIGDVFVDQFTFPEDSDEGIGLVNLYSFFNDDRGRENLTFTMLRNHSEISAYVNSTSHSLDFLSLENYFGTKDFQVRATDRDGLFTDSNVFDVIVTPTNDPPFIASFEDEAVNNDMIEIQAFEGQFTDFEFSAWDIDGDIPAISLGPDYDYSDIFSIIQSPDNTSSGILLVDPEDEHIGTINFTLIIDDLNSSHGRKSLIREYNISLEVLNTNDAPELEELGTLKGFQDAWLNFSLSAHDVDIDNDDMEFIKFSTNFSDYGIEAEKWHLDEFTGNFSFLSDNSLVGEFKVNFTVVDREGEIDWINMIIVIKNVNDPPIASPISFNIVDADDSTQKTENLTVNFTTTSADDPDLVWGDVHVYYWDFDGDGVLDDDGLCVEWTYSEAGNYTVTMTVSDSGIPLLSSTVNITIEVFAPIKKDSNDEDDDSDDDGPGAENTSGKRSEGPVVWLWIIIGIVMLIIILVLVFFFVITSRKKSEKAGDVADQVATTESQGQTSVSVPIQTLNLNPAGNGESKELTPALPAPLSEHPTGESTTNNALSPVCSKCGQGSQYYSEYDCYWCDPCQDYVFRNS